MRISDWSSDVCSSDLWSNPGDTVLTPFLGIGSEVYCAARMGRKGIGIELKPSYFAQAVRNLQTMERDAGSLFTEAACPPTRSKSTTCASGPRKCTPAPPCIITH